MTGIYAVLGAGGNDVIYDNNAARTVEGNAGDDVLYGMGGDDLLRGGAGNDTLDGGDGNDTFEVRALEGMDSFIGGSGFDRIVAQANDVQIGVASIEGVEEIIAGSFTGVAIVGDGGSNVVDLTGVTTSNIVAVRGGAGHDSITGTFGVDSIYGDAGNDTIIHISGNDIIDGGTGADTVIFDGNIVDYSINNNTITKLSNLEEVSIASVERIKFIDATIDLVIITNNAPTNPVDNVTATNTIIEGADTGSLVGITATSTDPDADDSVVYRLMDNAGGRFAINQATGAVSVANGALIDFETATSYTIQVQAYDGFDYSAATAFTIDVTNAGPSAPRDADNAANNTITENATAGTVVSDLVISASDPGGTPLTYVFTDASGKFAFDAGTGQVSLKSGQTIDNEVNQRFSVSLTASDGSTTSTSTNFIIDVVNVVENQSRPLTPGNDTFTAVSDDNWTISGQAGDDIITTRNGTDIVRGGAGNDTLSLGGGNDTIRFSANEGIDSVDGGTGTDTITATANSTIIGLSYLRGFEKITGGGYSNVRIAGSAGNDDLDFSIATITGITGSLDLGAGDDTVMGASSAETMIGGLGMDYLYGNDGNDAFLFGAGLTIADADVIIGGNGTDTIRATAAGTVIPLRSMSGIEAVTGSGFADVRMQFVANAGTINLSGMALTNIVSVSGGNGDNSIVGTGGNDTLFGGAGGSSGNDILNGGLGDDVLLFQSQGQVDQFIGGAGYDIVRATENNSRIYIGTGNTANGVVSGVEEINSGGFTGVAIEGQSQYLANGWGNQTIDLTGITIVGDIIIEGSFGNDTITGTAGADIINGKSGNDVLRGGAGRDALSGSSGSDIFDFDLITDSTTVNADSILDFVTGSDRLDLRTIDADSVVNLDQAFSFIGQTAFSGASGQLRYDATTTAGVTSIFGDIDGDMIADFRIDLAGTYSSLAATDFFL